MRRRHDDIVQGLHEETDDRLRLLLEGVRGADLAEMLERFRDEDQVRVLAVLDIRTGAMVLKRSRASTAANVIGHMDRAHAADLLDWLAVDDRASILEALPPEKQEILLREMESRTAEEVRRSLAFPPQSAGRMLQTHVVHLAPEMTAGEAFKHVRSVAGKVEKVGDLYVTDGRGALVGVLSLRELVIADAERIVRDLMTRDVVSIQPHTDQEQVARAMAKYDFTSLPVVDATGVLLGVVTVDDVLDIVTHEQTEDLLNLAGIHGDEVATEPYLRLGVARAVKSRVWWLMMLFVAESFTGTVLRHFEHEMHTVVALSFFIPLLIGTGGNAGSQTVSTVIRALALGEVQVSDMGKVIMREAAAGACLGLIMGLVAFARAIMWGTGSKLALAVALSVVAICTWANTVGAMVPVLAHRLKIDPTVVSAPFITTLVDASGLFLYFYTAKLILGI